MAILVVVTGWVGAAAIASGLAVREQAAVRRRALDALEQLQERVTAAESSQRGYLLTGAPSYLEGYRAAIASGDLTQAVRDAFAADREAGPIAVQLTLDVDHKMAELAETLHLHDAGDHAGALAVVGTDEGQRLSAAIAGGIAKLVEHQRRLEDRSIVELLASFRWARGVILVGTLVTFALAVVVNLSLVSSFRQRARAQQTVEELAAKLGGYTESLLRHERSLAEQLLKEQSLTLALQRSNEELDRFAYATSHDLKAPLRGITNLASWIEEDLGPGLPPTVKTNLDLLRKRARLLERLIEGILAYARAGRVAEKASWVDTRALMTETVDLIAPPTDVAIAIGQLPSLTTERVPLQQVFMNLLQNAITHGAAGGGKIEVGAVEDGDAWVFEVRDHGPGIAPQFQERVFGLFQTLAPRDRVEGAGIGLAVVRKLVDSRGGSVSLESQLGQGATFRVRWPKAIESAHDGA